LDGALVLKLLAEGPSSIENVDTWIGEGVPPSKSEKSPALDTPIGVVLPPEELLPEEFETSEEADARFSLSSVASALVMMAVLSPAWTLVSGKTTSTKAKK
jgi:hypothetical protein